jgi:predicted DNA binding protein
MPTITDLTVPGGSFALGPLLSDNPDLHVEIERLVPLNDGFLPFFWVTGGSPAGVEDDLESLSVVESARLLTTVDDRHLFEVDWTPRESGFVSALLATDGVILRGNGVLGEWKLRLRFAEHGDLRQFSELCHEHGVETDVRGVYNPHPPTGRRRLTSAQWQALALAHDLGYFDVPRQATLSDLAGELGVSEQAVSQRLRRATRALVDGLLFDGE